MSKPALMYSDDSDKAHIFDILWNYCMKNDRVLQCIGRLRHASIPKQVQLTPKCICHKKAFVAIEIPSIDMLNAPLYAMQLGSQQPEAESAEKFEIKPEIDGYIDKADIDAAKEYIDCMPFDLKQCFDPVSAKQREYIKSQVLGTPMAPVSVPENTKVLYSEAAKRFLKMLPEAGTEATGSKRRPANKGTRAAKKIKDE